MPPYYLTMSVDIGDLGKCHSAVWAAMGSGGMAIKHGFGIKGLDAGRATMGVSDDE